MLKNKNIFVSLQIEKNLETKTLVLNIRFDSSAPNFFFENEEMHWNPTSDEIDLVTEVVNLLSHHENQRIDDSVRAQAKPFDGKTAILEEDQSSDPVLEQAVEPDVAPHLAKAETDEKIFIQADEKKIDEIIRRKRSGFGEEFVIKSDDKSHLDNMLKQKKKKG